MKETISDIIREMRDEVRTSRENNPDPRTRIFLSTSNMAIEDFADRLEAADTMEHNESLLQKAGATVVELMNKMNAQSSEIAELRECLRISSNAMEMVVQWLGKYPAWQEGLKNCAARNRKVLKGVGDGKCKCEICGNEYEPQQLHEGLCATCERQMQEESWEVTK